MKLWRLVLPFIVSAPLFAASPHTDHTFQLDEGEARPTASLEDAAWLVGSWQGTAFGKQFEEIWSAPSNGSMVGMFKLFDDDGIEFYELMLLTVEEGSLSLKVKHFTADFIAWEEKADFVSFRLVKKETGALHFSGLSFYQRGPDQIDGFIVMNQGEETAEHALRYQRVK